MAEDSPSPAYSGLDGQDGPMSPTANQILAPSDFLRHLPPSTATAFGDSSASSPHTTNGHAPTSSAPSKLHVDAHGRTLNPRSCVTCRKRKVKCDKTHPCNNCNRAHIECVFPAPGRAPRKARKAGEGRDKELLDRLRRLEGVVKGLGVEVPAEKDTTEGSSKEAESPVGDQARARAGSGEASDVVNAPNGASLHAEKAQIPDQEFRDKTKWIEENKSGRFENRFGRLVINEGKSRYINNSFWANLSNEVEDLKGILNQSSDDDEDGSPNSNNSSGTSHQGFVFGYSSQNIDLLNLHPLPNMLEQYWETYKERVDPLVKVLHIPTVEPTVLAAASHLSNLSKGFEALLFAIYYGATTSLSTPDCLAKFGEEKSVLLSRYRFAVEQALARANFLVTEEAIVLQAFVIFLICLRRNNDARVIWTLTGLVVRIAQTLGIHRDGSHFGLQPFDIEMRRRLWWQVCILDTRASEDHGCDPTIIEQSFDTKLPLNINDVDIYPDIKDFPPERQGCTDMSFCLIRFEVANTFRRINYIPPGPHRCNEFFSTVTLNDKEKWITECHQRLEERYLKYCDMSVPIFWVTATVARLMMSKMWLMVYHPFQRQDGGASLSSETKEKLFITSLENVEYSILLETEARTMKWGWLFRTYIQWHALAFMLSELCHRTTGDIVERAWTAMEQTRDGRWGIHITEDTRTAGHLWRPLRKLYRRAKDARQRGLQEELMAKQRPNMPTRHYSPNANPMFGHPNRPQMVRAPLSSAQLQRFSEGPSFGEIPVDKHELLKSPKLCETLGTSDVDPIDTVGLQANLQYGAAQDLGQDFMGNKFAYEPMSMAPHGPQVLAPTAQQGQRPPGPPFGKNFLSSMGQIDFGMLPETTDAGSGKHDLAQTTAGATAPVRMNSLDSNNFDLEAAGLMDTSGDLNWESWDQLVRQYGMELDQNPDGGVPANWAGPMTWNLGANGAGPNMRMGPGMGMGSGSGDWF